LHKALVLKKLGQFVKPELPVHFRLGGGFRLLEPYFHLIGTLCVLAIVSFHPTTRLPFHQPMPTVAVSQKKFCARSVKWNPACTSLSFSSISPAQTATNWPGKIKSSHRIHLVVSPFPIARFARLFQKSQRMYLSTDILP